MRRKDRQVSSFEDIMSIVRDCKVMRLAMVDDGKAYIVPLNFGYSVEGDKLSLYFHSAREGRKLTVLAKSPYVCFEMDCGHSLQTADAPCEYSYLYRSVIGEAAAELLQDEGEKGRGLSAIMKHQSGKDFSFTSQQLRAVCVVKLTVHSLSGKVHA